MFSFVTLTNFKLCCIAGIFLVRNNYSNVLNSYPLQMIFKFVFLKLKVCSLKYAWSYILSAPIWTMCKCIFHLCSNLDTSPKNGDFNFYKQYFGQKFKSDCPQLGHRDGTFFKCLKLFRCTFHSQMLIFIVLQTNKFRPTLYLCNVLMYKETTGRWGFIMKEKKT